jgi:hypothetical protein
MRQDPPDHSRNNPQADPKRSRPSDPAAVVLGYLNFSSGAFDPAVWRAMNALFATIESAGEEASGTAGPVVERPDAAAAVAALLTERLETLAATEPAFRDVAQARAVLDLLFVRLLPAYREFHGDLLEHQPAGGLERPFFLMAAAKAILASNVAGDLAGSDPDTVVQEAIGRLNDYVGWRPVAVLENSQLSEPYPHERVRPVPLFIRGAGAAHGRYCRLVEDALAILEQAPEQLLRQADFDLALLEELAFDPRAFDFMHPAASRPNYLFGLWDPACIDGQGFYRRMVVQQATLDGILSWAEAAVESPDDREPARQAQLRRESAAVLAGVILMASGLSGHGPGAASASLSLADLLPRIAGYRDEFYRWLMAQLPEDHRQLLDDETRRLRQPFGGVRRHINSLLAGRRARQVESVALAAVLARLGRADGAERMAGMVPAASARMAARITSRVVAAQQSLRQAAAADESIAARESICARESTAALDQLDAASALLMRAVACGAVVDPWNILGLGGQFPLHEPGGESLSDSRVDDLVAITESILDGYAAVWRQAALDGPPAAAARAAAAVETLGGWWDRFATTTVSGVPHLSGREVHDSAREVIAALARRRETAPLPPPPGFWRQEVALFSSPETHAQATDCLLHEGDLDGAMGLLVHWASLLEGPAIDRSGGVWMGEATRWMARACADRSEAGRSRVRRFIELVEANTSGVADVIAAAATGREPGDGRRSRRDTDGPDGMHDDFADEQSDDAEGSEESVASAYESMVWRDSTDDGVDGGMLDMEGGGGSTLAGVAAVEAAAEFMAGVCKLLADAAVAWCTIDAAAGTQASQAEVDAVADWRQSVRRLRRTLVRAAKTVAGRDATPSPGMSPTEFDKLRWHRDAAAEQMIEAAVQASETLWMLSARLHGAGLRRVDQPPSQRRDMDQPPSQRRHGGKASIGRLFAALLAGEPEATRDQLALVRSRLVGRMVLYVPLSRGGDPKRIVLARSRERLLTRLAACLPRLGLVAETAETVHLAKALESRRPRGAASVSEFDRVFEAATKALVERIVETATAAEQDGTKPETVVATQRILDGLSLLVPRLLDTWTAHARQLRLSVLERLRDEQSFTVIREFVERYGAGLFTQQLLSPPSLRGILRGGVRKYLEHLVDRAAGEPDEIELSDSPTPQRRPTRLLEDLASGALPIKQAAARLRLVLESVAENHAEYRDWNSTTTQSDRGECLHVLLDFLRIKAEHERIAWTLRPVNMAHRVLARRSAVEAAEAWRGRMRDETSTTAESLVERLTRLEAHWGVRLASVSDRVRRPFTTALEQDELEALVDPAVQELFTGSPAGAGGALEACATRFLGVASGSGVEVPAWLDRLTTAVDRSIDRADAGLTVGVAIGPAPMRLPEALPWAPLPWDALHAALAK